MRRTPKPFTPRQARVGRAVSRVGAGLNARLYRLTKGRLGGRLPGGAPICLLTTRGRKTGRSRTVPLLYLADGDNVVVVASFGGMPDHPDWYGNLVVDPHVSVEIEGVVRALVARTASPDERAVLWPRLVAMYRNYDTYQVRTAREIPVVVCGPTVQTTE